MTEAIVTTEAQTKLAEAEAMAAKLGVAESQVERGWGLLACRLKDISENRYWEVSYKSFGEFLAHLRDTHNLGRAQLYNYISSARELAGVVTEDQFTSMGISKAMVLRDAKTANPILPADAVAKALDPDVTAKELKKILFESNNLPTPEEGSWVDLGFEFMVTDEERQVLQAAANAARHTDPPVKDTLKPSAQAKEIALRWAMEYLGGHADNLVEGGKGL